MLWLLFYTKRWWSGLFILSWLIVFSWLTFLDLTIHRAPWSFIFRPCQNNLDLHKLKMLITNTDLWLAELWVAWRYMRNLQSWQGWIDHIAVWGPKSYSKMRFTGLFSEFPEEQFPFIGTVILNDLVRNNGWKAREWNIAIRLGTNLMRNASRS